MVRFLERPAADTERPQEDDMLTLYPTRTRLALVDEIAHHHVTHAGNRYLLDDGRNVTARAEELVRDGWAVEDPRDPAHHLVLTTEAAILWIEHTHPDGRPKLVLPCECPEENVVAGYGHRLGCRNRVEAAEPHVPAAR